MHSWLADPKVMRYLTWGVKTFDESARHLSLRLTEQQQAQRRRYCLAVELRTSRQVIGDAGLVASAGESVTMAGGPTNSILATEASEHRPRRLPGRPLTSSGNRSPPSSPLHQLYRPASMW
jgi:hypothetical protein